MNNNKIQNSVPSQTRRRRVNRLRARRPAGRRNPQESGYRLEVSKGNQHSMPDSEIVDLPWTDTNVVHTAAATFLSWRYRGNSPYDPDPLLGGESALFFAEYAALYRNYRVLTAVVECTIVNMESFPIAITYAPTDADFVASISSNARVFDLGEMPYAVRPLIIGPVSGMNKIVFRRVVHWPKFVGNKQQYMADDLFGAFNNTNPSHTTYLTFAATANANMTVGFYAYIRVIYRTLWTDHNYVFGTLKSRMIHKTKQLDSDDEKLIEDVRAKISALKVNK